MGVGKKLGVEKYFQDAKDFKKELKEL